MFDITQLKHIRQQLGMTQVEFARHAGVSQSLITKIESGSIDPKYSTVLKIAQAITALAHPHRRTVNEILQKQVISAHLQDSLEKIVKKMQAAGISQVPVVDGQNVVGLLSERTILAALAEGKTLSSLIVENVMEQPPPTVPVSTPLDIVNHLLEYVPLVVVKEKQSIAGILTKADLIRASLKK